MGLFSKDIKSLQDLFMHGLKDLFYAENQILKALPDMTEKATDAKLKTAFENHRAETEGHVHRLRQAFDLLGAEAEGDKCPAIDGILKEGQELMGEIGDEDTMNAGLAFAAQAVEHYEITRYGALIAYASELGHSQCLPLFKANLEEEKAADEKLTELSERRYNPNADRKPAKRKATTARRGASKRRAPAKHSTKKAAKKSKRRA